MRISISSARRLLYLLIFVSGASGLIYEVVWHRYLSILLGAQARATALTLAIFLGGISAGYAIFGRWSRDKKWNLFLVYSLVEIGLAVWALLFPSLFHLARFIAPKLYGAFGIDSALIDIGVSIALIGFPTFLMGGTLPLLTQALSESLDEASSTHARIYGYNTLGACFGSLLAGYVLIPETSLSITVYLGACGNVFVAVVTYVLFGGKTASKKSVESTIPSASALSPRTMALFGVGFLSGFYILTLETILIRLMGLSTGSSNYNFTLVVSIFVFGLGFGSLLVKQISHYTESRLFWNQVGIAVSLTVLYLTADTWPYWVHLVRIVFRDVPESFYYYQVALGAGALALLIVPVGLCGLTLPLCFHLVKDRQESLGYRVGQLYGINTAGCVLGALIGGYALLYIMNLDHLFKLCVACAAGTIWLAGYTYLTRFRPSAIQVALGSSLTSVLMIGVFLLPAFRKAMYIQPFRQQQPVSASYQGSTAFMNYISRGTEYLVYKDGPNTSVGITASRSGGQEKSRTIFVNGKSDGDTTGDYFTMALTGHYAGLFGRKPERACVIGHGTGITTGTLATYPDVKSIDLVDIADTILKNSYFFDRYNNEMSSNPKVHFHAMDALRYLEGTKQTFNVIVSEPSNPWVAGVENLYSAEFYQMAREKLAADGIFVQWVQVYSFNDELMKMVLKSITSQFTYVRVFQMLPHDMALVASQVPIGSAELTKAAERLKVPAVKRLFEQTGLTGIETLLGLELSPPSVTRALGEDADEHHLEAPRLSNEAAKAFYAGTRVKFHGLRRTLKEYYPAMDEFLLSLYLNHQPPSRQVVDSMRQSYCENDVSRSPTLCQEAVLMSKWLDPNVPFEGLYENGVNSSDVRDLASYRSNGPAKGFSENDLSESQLMFDLYKKYYSPIARIPVGPILSRLNECIKQVVPTDELHGDCLLQKAAVLEIVDPKGEDFVSTAQRFSDWFTTIPTTSKSYSRYRRGRQILGELLKDVATKVPPHA